MVRHLIVLTAFALSPMAARAGDIAPASVIVETEAGEAIADASVIFTARGQTAVARSDSRGHAQSPLPGSAHAAIGAPGYRTITVTVNPGAPVVVRLVTDAKVIGRVTVATGTSHDLHTLPMTALSLDPSMIRATAPMTSDGLLSLMPGFDEARSNSQVTNPTQLRASIGGAGQDRGLVLVDGLPAENGFGGWIEWPAISPLDISRVEFMRDAASALYGSGAIGGVVDIHTLAPTTLPKGFVDLSAGANGGGSQVLSLGGGIGRAATRLFVSHAFDGGYSAAPPGYRSGVDGLSTARTDDLGFAVRLPAARKDRSLELSVKTFDTFQATGRPNYNDEESGWQEALAYRASAGGSTWQLSGFARSGLLINSADMFPQKPGVPLYRQTIPNQDDGVIAAWSHATGHDALRAQTAMRVVNGSYTQVNPTSGALQSQGGGRQAHASFSVSDELVSGRFDVIADLHAESVSTTGYTTSAAASAQRFGAASPLLAVRYTLSPALTVHASEGAGFRTPFLNELYRRFRIGAQQFLGNPLLGPERSTTRNLGADLAVPAGRLFVELTGTRVSNAISFVTTAPDVSTRENIERTATDGYEAGWQGDLGSRWSLRATYAEQYARVVSGPASDLGQRLPFIPAHEGSLTAIAHWPSGVSLALSGTLLGQTYADDLNLQPLGSAFVVGATLNVPLSPRTALALRAANLTNQTYLTSVDRQAEPARLWLDLRTDFGR
ncbi:TonB-dependent receptor [bacterium]|nr:MAG: TonB-dependent receptor [bacterium]